MHASIYNFYCYFYTKKGGEYTHLFLEYSVDVVHVSVLHVFNFTSSQVCMFLGNKYTKVPVDFVFCTRSIISNYNVSYVHDVQYVILTKK